MPTYIYRLFIYPLQNSQIGLFMDLAQLPSLDGEGAEGGWGDMEFSE